jgi:hypothetical protein
MADYIITYTGHIIEPLRPENFPTEIQDSLFISADTEAGLGKAVNDGLNMYIRLLGMYVRKDPSGITKQGGFEADRMWVPMGMLSYIDYTVKKIQSGGRPVLSVTGDAAKDGEDGEQGYIKQ